MLNIIYEALESRDAFLSSINLKMVFLNRTSFLYRFPFTKIKLLTKNLNYDFNSTPFIKT